MYSNILAGYCRFSFLNFLSTEQVQVDITYRSTCFSVIKVCIKPPSFKRRVKQVNNYKNSTINVTLIMVHCFPHGTLCSPDLSQEPPH